MADKSEWKTPSMEGEGKGDGHQYGRKPGVTGQSIPPVELYPGLKRPRLDYTRVYYGLGKFIPRGILSSSSFLSFISVLTMRLLQDSSRPLCLSPPLPDADPPPLRKVAPLTSLPTFLFESIIM